MKVHRLWDSNLKGVTTPESTVGTPFEGGSFRLSFWEGFDHCSLGWVLKFIGLDPSSTVSFRIFLHPRETTQGEVGLAVH